MGLIPYTNEGKTTVHVGGKAIRPGETREVDETLLHDYAPQAAAPEAPADPLAEILGHSVKAIVEMLPAMSDDELDALGAAEQAKGDEARKTLLGAIAEEILKRADAGQGGEE